MAMGVATQKQCDAELSLYDEATLVSRLSKRQSELVIDVLRQASRAQFVTRQNTRLLRDLAGSVDRIQEVHHRVRNHLQTVTGLLSAEEIGENSPSARRALHKSVERLTSVAAIHDLLARDPCTGSILLPDLVQELAQHLIRHVNAQNRIDITCNVAPITLDTRRATALVLILTELVSNAIEHGVRKDDRGRILVRLCQHRQNAILEVSDNGQGLPPKFTFNACESLGLSLVHRLAERDLQGTITASTGGGARFRLSFPLAIIREDQ